jgi:menaquinone-dependent protoporphyrinogen oxidase
VAHIAVVFGTIHGQAAKVARRAADVLRDAGHRVEVVDTRDPLPTAPLQGVDGVVLVGSVRMGKFQKPLVQFVRSHREALEGTPTAFLAVSLSAARDNAPAKREVQKTLAGFVKDTGMRPRRVLPVAGALLYTRYPFFLKLVMLCFSKMAGGDTDMSRDYEYTDWDAVSAFASSFGQEFELHESPQPAMH